MKAAFLLMALFAQDFADEKEYVKRMHEIDHSFSVLQKHREVRRISDVEKEAEKLATLFEQVEKFWKGRGDEDLAGFARMAKEGAEKAREAAGKNEEKALQASVDTIARSCEGCHREPLDKYRIPRK
jgi:tRNA nucleotidyltransferase/poly(A) polymerase